MESVLLHQRLVSPSEVVHPVHEQPSEGTSRDVWELFGGLDSEQHRAELRVRNPLENALIAGTLTQELLHGRRHIEREPFTLGVFLLSWCEHLSSS